MSRLVSCKEISVCDQILVQFIETRSLLTSTRRRVEGLPCLQMEGEGVGVRRGIGEVKIELEEKTGSKIHTRPEG